MSPGNSPPRRRGNLRVATREWGPGGAGGLIGLTRLIGLTHHHVGGPARQVTFQVTYGGRWGANRANRGVGGGGTPRSVSRVQHRDLVIGHGWPW